MLENLIMTKRVNRGVLSRGQRGFSIIELLVAIIIIGILVAILVPVISSRTEQARQAKVQSDLENLAAQMERAAVDTGYYVRIFVLNDVLFGDGIGFDRGDNDDVADALRDYRTTITQPFYEFPTQNSLFIEPRTGDFAEVDRDRIIERLTVAESRYTGAIVWNGPYINWQQDNNLYNDVLAPDGIPDDPWGNNYLFFTREGLLLEPDGEFVTSTDVLDTGGFATSGQFDTELFDRPTMLSVGPNGVPGNGIAGSDEGEFGKGDDFARPFGR